MKQLLSPSPPACVATTAPSDDSPQRAGLASGGISMRSSAACDNVPASDNASLIPSGRRDSPPASSVGSDGMNSEASDEHISCCGAGSVGSDGMHSEVSDELIPC